MANTFGTGTDPLGLSLTNFTIVSDGGASSKDSAVSQNGTGEYLPDTHKTFNEKNEITVEYEANDLGAVGGFTIPLGGDSISITSVRIRTQSTGMSRLTITGHKHGSSSHVSNARTLTAPAFNGWGATDFIGIGVSEIEVQSGEWSAEIGHVDKQNNVGDFLCGRSQGVKITASTSAISDTEPVEPEDWKLDRWDLSKSNTDFYTCNASGSQYLGPAV